MAHPDVQMHSGPAPAGDDVRPIGTTKHLTSVRVGEAREGRLRALDWLRGLAALWVCLYHVDLTVQKDKYFGLDPISPLSAVGYRGVELFFILSGFVMVYAHTRTSDRGIGAAGDFVLRRVLRIYPAYLAIAVPLFVIAAITGVGASASMSPDIGLLIRDVLLIPRDDRSTFIPVVAWTLSHEMMFYLLFLTWFFNRAAAFAVIGIWGFGSVALALTNSQPTGWLMQTSAMNAYFIAGMLCAIATRFTIVRRGSLVPVGSLAALAAAIGLEDAVGGAESLKALLLALYAAAFTGLVCWFSRGTAQLPRPLAIVADHLGRVSYSLYLVNYPIVVALAMVGRDIGMNGLAATMFIFTMSLATSIAIADVLNRLVEQPMIQAARNIVLARRSRRCANRSTSCLECER